METRRLCGHWVSTVLDILNYNISLTDSLLINGSNCWVAAMLSSSLSSQHVWHDGWAIRTQ